MSKFIYKNKLSTGKTYIYVAYPAYIIKATPEIFRGKTEKSKFQRTEKVYLITKVNVLAALLIYTNETLLNLKGDKK